MKKTFALALIAFFAIAAWISIDANDLVVTIGDEDFDGPLGALLGTFLAGGVMALVAVIMTIVAVMVGFLLAGVGVLVMVALAGAALVSMAAISPLFLPLLIPFGIYWLVKRNKARKQAAAAAPMLPNATA